MPHSYNDDDRCEKLVETRRISTTKLMRWKKKQSMTTQRNVFRPSQLGQFDRVVIEALKRGKICEFKKWHDWRDSEVTHFKINSANLAAEEILNAIFSTK
jgi:hypothetical protein